MCVGCGIAGCDVAYDSLITEDCKKGYYRAEATQSKHLSLIMEPAPSRSVGIQEGMAAIRILCVDDDAVVLKSLENVLKYSGFEVEAVSTVPQALERISRRQFDVLLSDLNVGEPGDGFTVVSAMRRVQPHATTFILTGYPDIESAIRAIRGQVDNYFTKPLNLPELMAAIAAVANSGRQALKPAPPLKVWDFIRENRHAICAEWLQAVLKDRDLAELPLSREQRLGHYPEVLEALSNAPENDVAILSGRATELARAHGRQRFEQGYSIPQIVYECRLLQQEMSTAIQHHLLAIDLSTLVPDTFAIGERVQAGLEQTIRAYQGQIPGSLQSSLASLYKSPHLGVAIADEERIRDANDALLRMIQRTREELLQGDIDWVTMTPEEYHEQDRNALEQLREFGTCVPFEKELKLPDGTRLPFLMGAVRLNVEPLKWSAFLVDLREQRRLREAEQKLRDFGARYEIINRLAHEVNNPLAALMFTLHLLETHPILPQDARSLTASANEMLERMAGVVKQVLAESSREAA